MFQGFDLPDHGAHGAARLAALRAAMAEAGVGGFLVPRADRHQGENVPLRDERLAWLTGFTGSAGLCVALAGRAAVIVDGRYTLQARAQVDGAAYETVASTETSAEDWIAAALPEGAALGLDPWLHPVAELEKYEKAAERAGGRLVLLDENLVDRIWPDQPPPPAGAIHPHPLEFAGESAADKRARLAATLRDEGAAAALLTLPDSVAWLLNVRGEDVARMPAPLAFALLRDDARVTLFALEHRFDSAARAHLGGDVELAEPDSFGAALDGLAERRVRVDRASAPAWAAKRLEAAGADILWKRDPCVLPKATKNAVELDGARAAHRRDGAAMAAFLRWLAETAPAGGLSEIDAVKRLEAFRAASNALRDIAFETICGAGEHGAIVHYRVTRETDRPIRAGEPVLIDSGGQYQDGTTDVTRTVAVGAPEPEARRLFTLVLKGMIAISRARFPEKTAGRELDPLARRALWAAGHDYDHGTGHGVGSYLGVHEGPQSLSRRGAERLRPGMICSNEPGCYLEGRFGIRVENLVVVTEAEPVAGGARPMMGFETLTLVPIDRALIDADLLDADERGWLDAYHARVLAEIGPMVDDAARDWLAGACAPLEDGMSEKVDGRRIEIEPVPGVVVVRAGGAVIGESRDALTLREEGREPVYYLPRADVEPAFLEASDTVTTCPWKGEARHFHIEAKSGRIPDAAWSYESPKDGVAKIAGMLAFYPDKAAVERL